MQTIPNPAQSGESPHTTNAPNSDILEGNNKEGDPVDKQKNFARNLEALRKVNGQSLSEFAKEAGLPKSTLQSVRLSGNTTLDTAIKISDALNIPLDSLVGDDRLAEKIDIVEHTLRTVDYLKALSSSEREEIALHFRKILEVICK